MRKRNRKSVGYDGGKAIVTTNGEVVRDLENLILSEDEHKPMVEKVLSETAYPAPGTFRSSLWDESVRVIKESVKYRSFENFKEHVKDSLSFNSSESRRRYALYIIKWFFPNQSLDVLPAKVWYNYHDEELLKDVMRYQYLTVERAVADFVVDNLIPLVPGTQINSDYVRSFVIKKFGGVKKESYVKEIVSRIGLAVKCLGFVYRSKGKIVIQEIPIPKTALLILTHHLFARTPRTVTMREILRNPYWKYLGIRNQDTVRKIFKEANGAEIIAKYITADELEQVTTKYTLEEFLKEIIRL